MRRVILALLFIFIFAPSFSQPTVNFGATTARSGYASLPVTFRDSTTGGHLWKWHWVFDNLNVKDTSSVHPSVAFTYSVSGTYSVKLVVYDSLGHIDSMTKANYVTIKPQARFSPVGATNGYAPFTAHFTNQCSGGPIPLASGYFKRYLWNFGTGKPADTSALATPTFTYTLSGVYNVKLTVWDSLGNVDSTIKLACDTVRPQAKFTATPQNGCGNLSNPLNVTFANTFTGGHLLRTHWVFDTTNVGDSSNITSPLTTYNVAGSYTVKQVIYDSLGNVDSTYKTILVTPRPTVRFSTLNPTDTQHHCAPYTITFVNGSDTTIGAALLFKWYIDTAVITTTHLNQNATFTFTKSGDYTITLYETESNNCGTTQLTKNAYIHIDSLPVPCFSTIDTNGCGAPYPVTFLNCSSNALTYLWKFGDGTTDTSTSPVHYYMGSNTTGYSDTLIAYTAGGCAATAYRNHYIKVGHFNAGYKSFAFAPPSAPTQITCIGSYLSFQDTLLVLRYIAGGSRMCRQTRFELLPPGW